MERKQILRYICIVAIFTIACILVIAFNKFEFNVNYSKNVRLELDLGGSFAIGDIINITSEVYKDEVAIVRSAGNYGETVAITVKDSTDEQNEQLINKVNEKFETNYTVDDLKIYYNSNIKGTDTIKPYVLSSAIAGVLILAFFGIRYRKLGLIKILASVIGTVIGTVILYLALTSIFKMEINEISVASGLAIVIFCLMYMIVTYERMLSEK